MSLSKRDFLRSLLGLPAASVAMAVAPSLVGGDVARAREWTHHSTDDFLRTCWEAVPYRQPWIDLTPRGLAQVRADGFLGFNLVPSHLFIGGRVWGEIVRNAPDWNMLFDPATQFDVIEKGMLGSVLGVYLLSDVYFPPTWRVFRTDEAWLAGPHVPLLAA